MGELIAAERFVEQYKRHTGELPPAYYHHTKMVARGWIPDTGQMVFFLGFGDIIAEELPWGKAVYHIPQVHTDDMRRQIQPLLQYFPYSVDQRKGRKGQVIGERVTIFGPYRDERGRTIVEAITGLRGQVERINYTRRDVVERLQDMPPPNERLLYYPGARRPVKEPVYV